MTPWRTGANHHTMPAHLPGTLDEASRVLLITTLLREGFLTTPEEEQERGPVTAS